MLPSLKGFGLMGSRKGTRHLLRDDRFCGMSRQISSALTVQRKEWPSWTGVRKEDLKGGVPDRTPGSQVSGEDWEEHSKLRNSMSQSSKTSSMWAAWRAEWGGGTCRGLRREEAGTEV